MTPERLAEMKRVHGQHVAANGTQGHTAPDNWRSCLHEVCATVRYSPAEREAIRRYRADERLQFSTGIDGKMTHGYGMLDEWGFWEYPMPFFVLSDAHKQLVRECNQREATHG